MGFIRRLPERLLSSFQSTLQEVCEASLLVVVVDASDPERNLHIRTTLDVLDRLGASEVPRYIVFNKLDCLSAAPELTELRSLCGNHPFSTLSAHNPEAVAALKDRLLETVRNDLLSIRLFIPYDAGAILPIVYRKCRIIKTEATPGGLDLHIEATTKVVKEIRGALQEVER